MKLPFEVKPIAGALGAEILGINLTANLDVEVIAAIRRASLEHLVIFFRDQQLSPSQYLAFARAFGEPIDYPFLKGLPEAPQIIAVLKREDEAVNFGGIWHSDTAYLEKPPMASMLIAREVPEAGGGTEVGHMYLAYETPFAGMKL